MFLFYITAKKFYIYTRVLAVYFIIQVSKIKQYFIFK